MARKTDGEKIDELEKIAATLTERLDNLREELEAAGAGQADAAKMLLGLEKESIHFKRDVDDLKKWRYDLQREKDESVRRLWAFGPNLIGAVVNVLLSAIVSGLVAYVATRQ